MSAADEGPPPPAPIRPRLLLVDDDAGIRSALRGLLEEEGFEVLGEAEDGKQGVDLALELRPDVVVMDIRMPVMGGIEATRRIRELESRARVVVLTVYDDPGLARAAREAGAYDVLVKGCPPGVVRDTLMRAWQDGRGDREAPEEARGR